MVLLVQKAIVNFSQFKFLTNITMTEEEYITQRLDEQMAYYASNSAKNKKYYYRSKVITIILSASLPFLTGLSEQPIAKVAFLDIKISHLIGLIGVIIAVLSGITGLFKYHETWINYRKIKEQLKREKIMYQTQSGIYETNPNFKLFITNVEKIIDTENNNWIGYSQGQNGQGSQVALDANGDTGVNGG